MSASAQLSRTRAASHGSSARSSKGRTANMQDFAMTTNTTGPSRFFEPCTATASMFLYAQGSSIVCCHHDTLTIERRFARHSEEVQLLAVDNYSETGAGRLVVSYDAGQTAIVWDLMTGDEMARFASYENLTCAAWMRNGNVAFGNSQGNIMLFEPSTSEHISARTIDQIAVTSIAPSADCRTFAIGYQNGSLLIATLQPRFTILHNLSTSRAPSPISMLAWHAGSSSRSKSDMLAVQTRDGDLRVWSVSKSHNSDDPAKVVRILKRTDELQSGPNWMGWSKNGRIIQFQESETISWDVRTKHVTFDAIPTPENIRGLAIYGPGASLFTLGANNTMQQFDLNAPARMVANVQHPTNLLPPSPPISLEEQDKGHQSQSEPESIPIRAQISESEEEHMSPLARLVKSGEPDSDIDRLQSASPSSSRSRSSITMSSTSSQTPAHRGHAGSIVSRGLTDNTYISAGSSSMRSGTGAGAPYRERRERDSFSTTSSFSMASSYRSRHRPSRLRHEIPQSPDDSKVQDLFKFTKSRLVDVPFRQPNIADNSRLTNGDLRRQMLSTIFGWNKEVDDLVRDEMSRHPLGSASRILLAKWLGDMEPDIMATSSQNMTSSDWMLLALSGIGNKTSQNKLGRAYVQRLLENGEVHAAATIMIGMGDQNDAIEIYISHKKYMEALILTCFCFPSVWERQEQIVKKWGEWAIQHGQQQLAIRCFACTGKESTEPWTSPSAAQLNFPGMASLDAELLSPPLSPPPANAGPQRSIGKTSALKLITSFGDPSAKAKFFANNDGATPIAAGTTPIAESAISPAGFGGDPTTAVLRPSNLSAFNTPSSARPVHGFGRQRLPSIGEAPDANPRSGLLTTVETAAPKTVLRAKDLSRSRRPEEPVSRGLSGSPQGKDVGRSRDAPPPSPSPQSLVALMEGSGTRNGSRTRIPAGLELQLRPLQDKYMDDVTSPDQSVASSTRYHWPSRRRGPASVASSVTSANSSVAKSHGGHHRHHYAQDADRAARSSRVRGSSRDGRGRVRDTSRSRKDQREDSQGRERGRGASQNYVPKGPKRSPTSPIPMSPEDLINLATPRESGDSQTDDSAKLPGDGIHLSRHGPPDLSRQREASKSRPSSRNQSPDTRRQPPPNTRGRSTAREGSVVRSPSSPLPMSAGPGSGPGPGHYYGSDDEDDLRQAVQAKEKFRRRKERSSSKNNGREIKSPVSTYSAVSTYSTSTRDTAYRDRTRDRSQSRRSDTSGYSRPGALPNPMPTPAPMTLVPDEDGHGLVVKDERQLKKEAAARELEERRKSLARRALTPAIPHPDQLTIVAPPRAQTAFSEAETRSPPKSSAAAAAAALAPSLLTSATYSVKDVPVRSASTEPALGGHKTMYASRGPMIGLPATPKAMRLVMESDSTRNNQIPVPPVPATFAQASTGNTPPASSIPSPGKSSPRKTEIEVPDLLKEAVASPKILLPSTVYTPPPPGSTRPPIARSMSAPPEELVPAPRGGLHVRQTSIAEVVAMSPRKASHDSNLPARKSSYDGSALPLPPPPPVPPVLKELQHLAMPPPPPPAPLPGTSGNKPVVYGGQTSGMIEIVMDDDAQPAPIPVEETQSMVPIIAAPAPPSSRNGHRRGRSSIDNSIAGRISRATERMRSASRNRAKDVSGRTKSPETASAPYESIPPPPPPLSFQARADMARSPVQQMPQPEWKTGLHQSEMI